MIHSRRDFLKSSGLLLAGQPLLSSLSHWMATPQARIALQLYTVREQIKKDLPGTLAKVRAAGFEYVETAFWPEGVTLQQAAAALRQAGLEVVSSHVAIPVGGDKEVFLETAAAMNTERLIWHGWPEDKRYSSLSGTKELIGIYNEAGNFAADHKLQFGLHNHWWEFRNHVGGKPVFEWLLAGVQPGIFFEIDTYWATVAGQNPALVIPQYGNRVKAIHLKDGPARYTDSLGKDEPEPMTALGEGKMNLPPLLKAAKPYVDTYIVEMDLLKQNPFEVIAKSHRYLKESVAGIRG